MNISFERVVLHREDETEARLVMIQGKLAGVLSKLSEIQGEQRGRWFLEWGLEPFAYANPDFADLNAARDWFERRISTRER